MSDPRPLAITVEAKARQLLERAGVPDAELYTAGDLVELANLLSDVTRLRIKLRQQIEDLPRAYSTLYASADDVIYRSEALALLAPMKDGDQT